MRTTHVSLAFATCFVFSAALVQAQTAPDATAPGPHATTSSEYKLPAMRSTLTWPPNSRRSCGRGCTGRLI